MNLNQHISSNPTIGFLAREWVKRNRPRFAKEACKISAAINLFAPVVEFFILEPQDYFNYAPAHFVLFAVAALSFGVLRLARAGSRLEQKLATWCLVSPAAGLMVVYSYFLEMGQERYLVITAMSFGAVTFFSSLYLHRFWREHYMTGVCNVLCLAALAALKPELRLVVGTLFSLQILNTATMHLFRRDFFNSAYERFKGYQAFLPLNIATNMVIAPEEKIEQTFAPATRYTICVCADWRDFQGLAAAWTPLKLSEAISTYYDLVCQRLAMLLPDDRYFFDWTADELFVVFFTDKGQEGELQDAVMSFVYELATSIHEHSIASCGFELKYDIGVASGDALVGIVGPKSRRKTTVIGKVPGVAKRLEAEAKRLRPLHGKNERPLVVMDETLAEAARGHGYMEEAGFHAVVAAGKDVKDVRCLVWQTPVKTGYRAA